MISNDHEFNQIIIETFQSGTNQGNGIWLLRFVTHMGQKVIIVVLIIISSYKGAVDANMTD